MNQPPPATNRSHEFQFPASALMAVVAPTVIAFSALVGVLHSLNWLDWLPAPRPALTGDQFVIRDRYETALADDPAEVIIIGDSSSVMGVDAAALSDLLPGKPQAYNLGLFLGLPMEVYAEAAQKFIDNHPDQVRAVVLLTTFSRLADAAPSGPSTDYWRRLWTGEPEYDEATSSTDEWLLLNRVRDGILTRLIPFERHGEKGVFYGGIVQAGHYVRKHRGSAYSHEVHNRQGSLEKVQWSLDQAALAQARRSRELIPRSVAFVYGVMPMPETYATKDSHQRRTEIMNELNVELGADHLLTNLPVTLPDGFFSDVVHLNRRGQEVFTRLLAAELAKLNLRSLHDAPE
jgi:hypothetical protein